MAVIHSEQYREKYKKYFNTHISEMELVDRYCKRYLDGKKYYRLECGVPGGPIPDITIWDKEKDEITVIEAKLNQISEVIRQIRYYIGQQPNKLRHKILLEDIKDKKIKCGRNEYHMLRQKTYTHWASKADYVWILLMTNQKKFADYNQNIIDECGIGVIKYNIQKDEFNRPNGINPLPLGRGSSLLCKKRENKKT